MLRPLEITEYHVDVCRFDRSSGMVSHLRSYCVISCKPFEDMARRQNPWKKNKLTSLLSNPDTETKLLLFHSNKQTYALFLSLEELLDKPNLLDVDL